ncbi:hypothetical protein K0M31_004831 [Melipona bicolor]|uniref:Uncharacterized protein n=1 Tax=Melipona bicolor TaxID=60889 RepID=A0AA40FWK0_9HYME|nr:hypothetical protein K0M31_004831 [Melipona bicolor]
MAMFLMSMTNFGDYYGAFERTQHEMEAKLLFVLYMAIVAILLVNMLIAMMGNTYQKIAETRNEWQRQWARIVLVVERGVSPEERLKKLMDYSQPMSDGRRALVLRLNQSEEDKEEMKEILEMKRTHDRLYKKRQSSIAKNIVMSEDNVITLPVEMSKLRSPVNYKNMELELLEALRADELYKLQNDAKLRAVEQKVPTYEDFRQLVNAAHLKPLKCDDVKSRIKKSWNPIVHTNSLNTIISFDKLNETQQQQSEDRSKISSECDNAFQNETPTTYAQFVQIWKTIKDHKERFHYLKTLR